MYLFPFLNFPKEWGMGNCEELQLSDVEDGIAVPTAMGKFSDVGGNPPQKKNLWQYPNPMAVETALAAQLVGDVCASYIVSI